MKKKIAWCILGLFAVAYIAWMIWAMITNWWAALIFAGAILLVWAGRVALGESR